MNGRPLPNGWVWANIGDLAADTPNAITDGPFGSNLKSDHYTSDGPRVIRLQNIGDGEFIDERAHISPEHFERLRKHHVVAGDLVVAILGERLPRACRIPPGVEPAIVKADCVKVSVNPRIADTKYVNWWLNSSGVQRRATAMVKGVGRPRINLSKLKLIPVAVPPLPEQRRIVAKIDELFSDLDAGVAALKRVKANLKRYRASVLKAAVEGRLTKEWRKKNPATEPAAKLLERILAERRAKWEADQLRKFKEAGKTPPKGWKEKYCQPCPPDTERLVAHAPHTWAVASTEQIADMSLGKMLDREKHQTGKRLPYLRNINVRWGWVDTSDLLEMFFEDDQLDRFGLLPGDVLVCEGGEPGRAAVWKEHDPAMKFQKAIHRVRCRCQFVGQFLVLWLEHLAKSGRLEPFFTGSTIKHFTGESFATLPIPVPSIPEQAEIVAEVDRRLSVADAAEMHVEHALQRAGRLRQAILKRAFDGDLVPQDPADESGTALLARIKTGAGANDHRALIRNRDNGAATSTRLRNRERA